MLIALLLWIFCPCLGFWRLLGVGDAERADPCVERQQVRGHVRVQRGDHVRAGCGHLSRPAGAEERLLRPDLRFHNILHNPHTLPRVCAKGEPID